MLDSDRTSIVPLNDLKRTYDFSKEMVSKKVFETLDSGWWLNGEQTSEFCKEFAAYLNVGSCIGVANGTDALEIAMRGILAVRKILSKEVITVANAGGYTTVVCRLLGLTPVYVDIEAESQLVRLDAIISAVGIDTALVVVTHLYGNVVDVILLRKMLDAAGYSHVPILEDCAQVHGGSIHGKMAGSMGDIATFSFYPTKNLGAFGDGGAIATSDDELVERCNSLRQYGWSSKYKNSIVGGRNSRLDEIQAAVLRVMLPELDKSNQRRLEILSRYARSSSKTIRVVKAAYEGVGHLAVVLCENRNSLRQFLADQKIQTDIHYPILDSDQPAWINLSMRFAPEGIQTSKQSVGCILTLPCFPTMKEQEIDRVCEALNKWSS